MGHNQVYLGPFYSTFFIVRTKYPTPPPSQRGLRPGREALFRGDATRHDVEHDLEEWGKGFRNSSLLDDISVQRVRMALSIIDDTRDAWSDRIVWGWEWPADAVDSLVCVVPAERATVSQSISQYCTCTIARPMKYRCALVMVVVVVVVVLTQRPECPHCRSYSVPPGHSYSIPTVCSSARSLSSQWRLHQGTQPSSHAPT